MNRIKKLKQEIKAIEREQKSCNHKWKEPFQKTFTEKEQYNTGEYETQGVHFDAIWSYRDKEVKKWVRECKKCGKEETTKKMKKIVVETEPDFR